MREKEILKNAKNIAVIGVTQNKDKYGYKIYKRLKELNKKVFPVSPIYSKIDEEEVYDSIEAIQAPIDLAVFVVNANRSREYIQSCEKIQTLWFQPNTYDEQLLKTLEAYHQEVILGCVLVASEEN